MLWICGINFVYIWLISHIFDKQIHQRLTTKKSLHFKDYFIALPKKYSQNQTNHALILIFKSATWFGLTTVDHRLVQCLPPSHYRTHYYKVLHSNLRPFLCVNTLQSLSFVLINKNPIQPYVLHLLFHPFKQLIDHHGKNLLLHHRER